MVETKMTESEPTDPINDNAYSVVEFLQKPAPNIGKYIIVPNTWIKERKHKIGVLYPEINRSQNLKDFFDFEPKDTPSLNWTECLAEKKYTAKSYDKARDYITKRSGGFMKKQVFLKETTPMKNNHGKKRPYPPENIDCDILQRCDDTAPQNHNLIYNYGVFMKNMGESLIRVSQYCYSDFNKLPLNAPLLGDKQQSKGKEVAVDCDDAAKRRKKRVSFSSPIEATAKSSKPTEKPQELPPGVEKLVDGYEVYIRSEILADVIRMSTNGIQFVRLLLPYILGKNTLGDYTEIFCKRNPKHVINENVLEALLKFTLIWESKKRWHPTTRNGLIAGIKSKLLNMVNQAKHK